MYVFSLQQQQQQQQLQHHQQHNTRIDSSRKSNLTTSSVFHETKKNYIENKTQQYRDVLSKRNRVSPVNSYNLSSVFSEIQPDTTIQQQPANFTATEKSVKKFDIMSQIYEKMSDNKGDKSVINLPGAVHVYGPPPADVPLMPQAQEPLNIVATPHLTKFHSFHSLNIVPPGFNAERRPLHLFTNRKPTEIMTGRARHVFLPFFRRHPVNRVFNRFSPRFIETINRQFGPERLIQEQPIQLQQPIIGGIPQSLGLPAALGLPQSMRIQESPEVRHSMGIPVPLESEQELLNYQGAMINTNNLPVRVAEGRLYGRQYIRDPVAPTSHPGYNTIDNAQFPTPRIINLGGEASHRFVPGKEITLGPNEDIDLAHLNVNNIQPNIHTLPRSNDVEHGSSNPINVGNSGVIESPEIVAASHTVPSSVESFSTEDSFHRGHRHHYCKYCDLIRNA